MLTLPIKKKWFDMILSGEKKEEYREIKPFKNRIESIYLSGTFNYIYMSIDLYENDNITFPIFKKGTKYKNMEINRKYTLEELGLD